MLCLPLVTYYVAQNFGERKLQGSEEKHIDGINLVNLFIIVIIDIDALTIRELGT